MSTIIDLHTSLEDLAKAGGPFIGPRGGKWADAKHTIPWGQEKPKRKTKKQLKEEEKARIDAISRLKPDQANAALTAIGDWLYSMDDVRELNGMGMNKMDFRTWSGGGEDLPLAKKRRILKKYKRQIIEGKGEKVYYALGLGDDLSKPGTEPYPAYWQWHKTFGNFNFRLEEFEEYGDKRFWPLRNLTKKWGMFNSQDRKTGKWWVVVKDHESLDWPKFKAELEEVMQQPVDLPDEIPAPPEQKSAEELAEGLGGEGSFEKVAEMIRNEESRDIAAIRWDEKTDSYEFVFSRGPISTMFSNKSGQIPSVVRWHADRNPWVTRVFDHHIAKLAMERMKRINPKLHIVKEGWDKATRETEQREAELQIPIPEVAAKLNPEFKLFPYQNEGVRFLLKNKGKCMLGDEMGLGKTLQCLSYLVASPDKPKAVVIVPKTVRRQWLKEADKFFPGQFVGKELDSASLLKVRRQHATMVKKATAGKTPGEAVAIELGDLQSEVDFVVEKLNLKNANLATINYESLDKFAPYLRKAGFDTMLIDESHRMKNPKAKVTKAINRMSKHMPRRVLMSGTAIKNSRDEFFTQFELVKEGLFATAKEIKSEKTGDLWDIMRPFYLARQKAKVLKDLPSKTTTITQLPADKKYQPDLPTTLADVANNASARAYVDALKEGKSEAQAKIEAAMAAEEISNAIADALARVREGEVVSNRQARAEERGYDAGSPEEIVTEMFIKRDITEFTRTRHALAYAKSVPTINFVKESLEASNSNFLVFTESKIAANKIAEELGDVAVLHTGDTPDERKELIKTQFDPPTRRSEETARVLVATISSLREGANLTSIDKVVFNDLPWTPADIAQAEARTHRPGQKHPVNVYWIQAENNNMDGLITNTIHRKADIHKKSAEGSQFSPEELEWKDKEVTTAELIRNFRGEDAGPVMPEKVETQDAKGETKAVDPLPEPPPPAKAAKPKPGSYYSTKDRKGAELHPGMRVSQPMYPKGTMRGTVEVGTRGMEDGPEGMKYALVVRSDEGTTYNLSGKALKLKDKGVPKKKAEPKLTIPVEAKPKESQAEKTKDKWAKVREAAAKREADYQDERNAEEQAAKERTAQSHAKAAEHLDTIPKTLRRRAKQLHGEEMAQRGGIWPAVSLSNKEGRFLSRWFRENSDTPGVEVQERTQAYEGPGGRLTLASAIDGWRLTYTSQTGAVVDAPEPVVEEKKPAAEGGPKEAGSQMSLFKSMFRISLEELEKAAGHKYLRRRKVKGRWEYDYGFGWGVSPQIGLFGKPKEKAKPKTKPKKEIPKPVVKDPKAPGTTPIDAPIDQGPKLTIPAGDANTIAERKQAIAEREARIKYLEEKLSQEKATAPPAPEPVTPERIPEIDKVEMSGPTPGGGYSAIYEGRKYNIATVGPKKLEVWDLSDPVTARLVTVAKDLRSARHRIVLDDGFGPTPDSAATARLPETLRDIRKNGLEAGLNQAPLSDALLAAYTAGLSHRDAKKVKWVYAKAYDDGAKMRDDDALTTVVPKGAETKGYAIPSEPQVKIESPDPEDEIPEIPAREDWEDAPVKLKLSTLQRLFEEENPKASTAADLFLEMADTPKSKKIRKNKMAAVGIRKTRTGWASGKPKAKPKPKVKAKKEPPVSKKDPTEKRKAKRKAKNKKKGLHEIQDTGDHVWGARKDLAALARELQEGKRTLAVEELKKMDFGDAAYLVSKQNLIETPSMAQLKKSGMTPGAAHLTLAIFSSIRAKPDDNAAARLAYVNEVRLVQGTILNNCKTRDDIVKATSEWRYKQRSVDELEDASVVEGKKEAFAEADRLSRETGVLHRVYNNHWSSGYQIKRKAVRPFDQLGSKFQAVLQMKGKAFNAAFREALDADQESDGWAYLKNRGKEDVADQKVQAKRKRRLKTMRDKRRAEGKGIVDRGISTVKAIHGDPVRKGGVQIKRANEKRTERTFNMPNIQYGKSMSQPDREFHTRSLEESLHDLSDMLGIPPGQVSFNHRLSIGLGARGKGKFLAHYESHRKIINITKESGVGSLAHEWGHALDNIVAEHFLEDKGASHGTYMSQNRDHSDLPKEVSEAMQTVWTAMTKHPDPVQARKDHNEKLGELKKEVKRLVDESNGWVAKHKELNAKIKPENAEAQKDFYQTRLTKYEAEAKKATAGGRGYDADNYNRWAANMREKLKGLESGESVQTKEDVANLEYAALMVDVIRPDINQMRGLLNQVRGMDPTQSSFANNAALAGEYWTRPWEMFARAFESFVEDKLESQDRSNPYLAVGTKGGAGSVYPHGVERENINKAMETMMATLRSTGHLEKALRALSGLAEPERFVLRLPA